MRIQKQAYIAAKVLANPEPAIKYFKSLNELYIKGIRDLPEWVFKLKKNKLIEIYY